jgi:hypothetical protein
MDVVARSKLFAVLALMVWVIVGVFGLDHCHAAGEDDSCRHLDVATTDHHGCHDSEGHVGPSDDHLGPMAEAKLVFVSPLAFDLSVFLPYRSRSDLTDFASCDPVLLLRPLALRIGTMSLRV